MEYLNTLEYHLCSPACRSELNRAQRVCDRCNSSYLREEQSGLYLLHYRLYVPRYPDIGPKATFYMALSAAVKDYPPLKAPLEFIIKI